MGVAAGAALAPVVVELLGIPSGVEPTSSEGPRIRTAPPAQRNSAETRQKLVWYLGRRPADPAQRLLRGGSARETDR